MNDQTCLRALARAYYEAAMDPVNWERMKLHRAVNDLKMIRPVVLIDEIPFHELNVDGSLTLRCTDPLYREAEAWLRKKLFQWNYFPADMILEPWYPVQKMIRTTGIGISVQDETIYFDPGREGIAAHAYKDQLSSPEDLEKIHLPEITYDREATVEKAARLAEVFGDLLPIRLVGYPFHTGPWDLISEYRGVDALLTDLIEEPEFTHQVVEKLYACEESRLSQMEALGLLELNPFSLHGTCALCSDLGRDYDGGPVRREHVWGRGFAQILSAVSPAMHEEFEINYMKKLMAGCAVNYYGCCEPLDRKMHIVEKLPNLRKVSVTPWADVDIAAEAIGKRYVLANKPKPGAVALRLDEDALREEIGRTLDAVKRNGCSCDIVLKDISSAGHDLRNLVRWEQTVMELVRNF